MSDNNIAKNINPDRDGIDFINIYSQGKTELGKMLSNFFRFHIETEDGPFESVEGYWHWLGIADCEEKEILRNLYGYTAKKTGMDLKKTFPPRVDENFEKKILSAIWYKIRKNVKFFTRENINLPYEHYYLFGDKVHNAKEKYFWMIHGIDKMRIYIAEKCFSVKKEIPMIYTCYFSKIKDLPANVIPVSICGKAPTGYKGLEYKKLAPKYEFFAEWKKNHDNNYYIKCFKEQILDTLDVFKTVNELQNLAPGCHIALICYEKPSDFCHRHLVADWLRKNGFVVEEWKANNQ